MASTFRKFISTMVATLAVFLTGNVSGETIVAVSENGDRTIDVVPREGEPWWLEIEFPGGSERRWIASSSHYVIVNDSIVGLERANAGLIVNRPVKALDEEMVLDRRSKALCLRLDAIFGSEKTSGLSAAMIRPPPISRVSIEQGLINLEMQLLEGAVGRVTLNSNLLIMKVAQDGKQIPVFDQLELISKGSAAAPDVNLETVVSGADAIDVWYRVFNQGEDSKPPLLVAKTIRNGREMTWIGPKPAKWVFIGDVLYGLYVYERLNILLRPALYSEELNFVIPKKFVEIEHLQRLERAFSGECIRLAEVIPRGAQEDPHSMMIQDLAVNGDVISFSFLKGHFHGSVEFDIVSREAALKREKQRAKLAVDRL